VVPRPERDAHERQAALDRDCGDVAERPVAAGDPDRIGFSGARERRRVLAGSERVRLDAALAGSVCQLARVGAAAP
jgi:hypothetical protein